MSVIEVAISRGQTAGEFRVDVVRSPAGEASALVALGEEGLLAQRSQLQEIILASALAGQRELSGVEAVVRQVGEELFTALLGSGAIAGRYQASGAVSAERGEELRVVLRIDDPALATLPWEAMYDQSAGSYVCRRNQLVRHIPVTSAPEPLSVEPPLCVLGVISSPHGLPLFDVSKEKEQLEQALAGSANDGLIHLTWAPDATWGGLQEVLLGGTWHVVHFIGHGDLSANRGQGVLALTRENGRTLFVEASQIVDLLRQARPIPRLVLLNSCSGAVASVSDLFSSTATALVRGGIGAVAAMQFQISDRASIAFARGFYSAAAHGRGVDDSVSSGRVAMLGLGAKTLEWIAPVLYLRGRDSRLFRVGTGAAATRGVSTAAYAAGRLESRSLADVSAEFVDRMGRRRTAYPLDMSLAELHRHDLFVPSRVTHYHDRASRAVAHAPLTIASSLSAGQTVLLLGEPGSGKSLTLFAVAVELATGQGYPIPIRAIDLGAFVSSPAWRQAKLRTGKKPTILIDGLDEAASKVDREFAAMLCDVAQHANALITSRAREYEDILAYEIADIGIDQVLYLQPWKLEGEFADYVSRLVAQGLAEASLYEQVASSPELINLVRRPLYARMLTYIGGSGTHVIADTATLYSQYLNKLGQSGDYATRAITHDQSKPAMEIWQAAARYLHLKELSADEIPLQALLSYLERIESNPAVVRRAIESIVDRRIVGGEEVGEYLHYSFYEYLLAREVSEEIIEARTLEDAVRVLRKDLSREVRHLLTGELRRRPDIDLTATLIRLYRDVRTDTALAATDMLAVCNLLLYLTSRTNSRSAEQIASMLADEVETFLLQAGYWALCHIGWPPALELFFDLLERSAEMRDECRGYFLYYYGDLPWGDLPFKDVAPYVSHHRTNRKMLDIFASSEYGQIPPAQRCMDLYTFLDIHLARGEPIARRDGHLIRHIWLDLEASDIATPIRVRMREMVKKTCGSV
jgi:hypothetical protein